MNLLQLVGLVLLVLVVISIPFFTRRHRRLGNLEVEKKMWKAYLAAVQVFDPEEYRAYKQFKSAVVVWFDPPLYEGFLKRARSLRKILDDMGRDHREAFRVWVAVIGSRDRQVLRMSAPAMLEYYDKKMEEIDETRRGMGMEEETDQT